MADNPLKYSDFICKDTSISDLIKALNDLRTTYSDTLKQIRQEAAALAESLNKVSAATRQGREAINKAASDASVLSARYNELNEKYKAATARITELEAAQKAAAAGGRQESATLASLVADMRKAAEAARSLAWQLQAAAGGNAPAEMETLRREMDAAQKSAAFLTGAIKEQTAAMGQAPGSLAEMRARLNELKAAWAELSPEMRDTEIGKNLSAAVRQMGMDVATLEAQLKRTRAEIGSFDLAADSLNTDNRRKDSAETQSLVAARPEFNTAEIQAETAALGENTRVTEENVQQHAALVMDYDQLKGAIDRILGTTAQLTARVEEEKSTMSQLKAEMKLLEQTAGGYNNMTQQQKQRYVELSNAYRAHKTELQGLQQVQANSSKLDAAQEGSMDQLSQQLSRMRIAYRSLSDEMKQSNFGRVLQASAASASVKIKDMDASLGNFQRNVGNYKSGFNTLNMGVQQVVRELPSLTMGWNTFFLAISNNLPILVDQIKAAQVQYEAMKKAGQNSMPVWKQLLRSVGSWQTVLLVVITLLASYSQEIIAWVKNLFKSEAAIEAEKRAEEQRKKAIEQSKKATEEYGNTMGGTMATYMRLRTEWNKLSGDKQRIEWLKKNKAAMQGLHGAISDVSTAEKYFNGMTKDVVKAFDLRAQAAALSSLITDKYVDYFTERQKIYNDTRIDINTLKRDKEKAELILKYTEVLGGKPRTELSTTAVLMPGEKPETLKSYNLPGARIIEQGGVYSLEISDRNKFNKYWNKLQGRARVKMQQDLYPKDMQNLLNQAADVNIELQNTENRIRGTIGTINDSTTSSSSGSSHSSVSAPKSLADEIKSRGKTLTESNDSAAIALIRDDSERAEKETEAKYKKLIDTEKTERAKWEAILKADAAAGGGAFKYGEETYQGLTEEQANEVKAQLAQSKEYEAKLEKEKQAELLKIRNEADIAAIDARLETVREGDDEEIRLLRKKLDKEKAIELAYADSEDDKDIINKKYAILYEDLDAKKAGYDLTRFDAEQEYHQSVFDLAKNTEDEIQRYKLEAEKKRWKKILELDFLNGKKLTEQDKKRINNLIDGLDDQIAGIGKDKSRPFKNFFDLLGIKFTYTNEAGDVIDVTDKVVETLDQGFQAATESLNDWMEAKDEAAQKTVENAETEVEAARDWLNAEREARANGYANNVAMAQKELAAAKKNQQKALKEQERVKKQQIAIDTAMQASSMILATANIWKTHTEMGPWGIPAAIAATALMWGAFIASRVKALQLASAGSSTLNTESYGSGTVELLQGGSHQSGRDVDLGRKPDGTRRRAEGGEFFAVINKRASRQYRGIVPDLVRSLNDGTFARKYMGAYKVGGAVVAGGGTDVSRIEKDVREIRKSNERRTYTDARGYQVTEYKNLTRRVRV